VIVAVVVVVVVAAESSVIRVLIVQRIILDILGFDASDLHIGSTQ